ncbi:MAG: hypothetical protein ABEI32_04475 [Halothece sp.]
MTKHKKQPWWKNIKKAWIPEIIIFGGLTLCLILFVLFKAFNISFWIQIQRLWSFVQNVIQFLLTPTTFIAILLIISLLYFALARIRYHLLRLANSHPVCPVCNHKIHKQHRKTYQRLLSYYIPVRRYYCSSCGWKGLRVYKKRRIPDQYNHFK